MQWILAINLSEYFKPQNDAKILKWAEYVYNTSISFYDKHNLNVLCVDSMDTGLTELMRFDKIFVLIVIVIGDLDKAKLIKKIKILREITTMPIFINLVESKMEISEVGEILRNGADMYTIHKTDVYSDIESALNIEISLIRRYTEYNHKEDNHQRILYINDLLFLLHSRRVFYKHINNEVKLTTTEFDVLLLLAQNIGIALSFSRIYERIWGDEYADDTPNAVWCQIRRIRSKISKFSSDPAKKIISLPGFGYRFDK